MRTKPNAVMDQNDRRVARHHDHNSHAGSLNKGPPVAKKTVVDEIYEWIVDIRKKDMPLTTLLIIAKALALDGAFHGGSISALWSWVYLFLTRRSLSIRRVTHEGQKLSGHLDSVRSDFVDCIAERFATDSTLSRVSGNDFVIMDETTVFSRRSQTK